MLDVFRENLRSLSWVLYLIIISFVLFFGVSWTDTCRSRRATGEWVAAVEDQVITRDTLAWTADQLRRSVPQDRLLETAVETLVQRSLVLDEASRMGLRVTDDELNALIQRNFVDPTTQAFVGRDAYLRLVQQGRGGGPYRSVEAHERWLREEIMLARWNRQVQDVVPGDEAFVQEQLRRLSQRAAVRYLLVDDSLVPGLDEPSEEELSAFAASRSDLLLREGVAVIFDESTVPPESLEVSESEIYGYVRENPDLYATPGRRQARAILLAVNEGSPEEAVLTEAEELVRQLQAGELDFEEAARSRSDHPSRAEGGDLGLLTREELAAVDPALPGFLFGAGQAGDTLGPLRGESGYWVLRLLRVELPISPEVLPEEQAQQVRALLQSQKLSRAAERQAVTFRRQVSSSSEIVGRAEEAGYTVRPLGPSPEGLVPDGLPAGGMIMAELFDLETGEVSRVLRLGRAFAVVGRLPLQGQKPPVSEYLDRVAAAVRAERASDKLHLLAYEASGAGLGLDDLAGDLGLVVQETTGAVGFDQLEATLGSEGRRAALTGEIGTLLGPLPAARGHILLEVVERPAPEPVDPALREQIARQVRAAFAEILAMGILESKREQAIETGALQYSPEYVSQLASEGGS